MTGLLSRVAAAIVTAIVVIAVCGAAHAERRVALVIGNSNYKAAGISLSNPGNDAQDVATVLGGLGFEVVTTVDATKRDMDLALQRFARLAADADSALFYYAGHAMQFQGRNYLMPTDAELEDEISVRYQMISMEDVRAALHRVNGVKILILDACRNNPLADRLRRLSGASRSLATTRGLARIDKTQGMVVVYATAADEVAQDGQGRNSPFTAALLKHLQEPGLEIEMMLRRVAYDVNVQTGGRQRPETYISLLSEYYLNQSDRIVWDRIKDPDDVAALRDFITKFPASQLAIIARDDLLERNAKEREELARRARKEEEGQRKAVEAGAQHLAREAARREAEARQQAEQLAAQQRLADEQKRQQALQQAAEQKRLEDERKRQQAPDSAALSSVEPMPDRDQIAALVARGGKYFAAGDMAAARLVLRPAALAGDSVAALALGETYDPMVLKKLGVIGVSGDPAEARDWYRKAAELGSADAPQRLEQLAGLDR